MPEGVLLCSGFFARIGSRLPRHATVSIPFGAKTTYLHDTTDASFARSQQLTNILFRFFRDGIGRERRERRVHGEGAEISGDGIKEGPR